MASDDSTSGGHAPLDSVAVDSREIALEDLQDDKLAAVLDYWSSVRGTAFAPSWQTFDLLGLPAMVIPSMTVVDLLPGDPPIYRYRFWGTHQATLKARDYTGRTVLDLRPAAIAEAVLAQYRAVVRARGPMAFRHNVQTADGGMPVIQTTARLPLSNDGETVEMFVSCCNFSQPVHAVREVFAGYLVGSES